MNKCRTLAGGSFWVWSLVLGRVFDYEFLFVRFYIRVWCSGVVIWCGDFVGCSHFWPIYLSVTELFGDLDAIDIKYQFFLCDHFLFFFRYLFCKRVTDLYRNWNFSKSFKIFLSERTSKYSFLRCSPPYLNFLLVKYLQIDKHWRYYYDTNFG